MVASVADTAGVMSMVPNLNKDMVELLTQSMGCFPASATRIPLPSSHLSRLRGIILQLSAVFGRVMKLQALENATSFGRRKGFVKGGGRWLCPDAQRSLGSSALHRSRSRLAVVAWPSSVLAQYISSLKAKRTNH